MEKSTEKLNSPHVKKALFYRIGILLLPVSLLLNTKSTIGRKAVLWRL
jgi:hypothetical protein